MTMDNGEELIVPEEEAEKIRYAGFWMRFWAYFIDAVILFSINGFIISPLVMLNEGMPIEIGFWTLQGVLAGILYYAYFLLMTKMFQQTVGKMILGIKVVSENKDKPSWLDLVFRECVGRFIYNVFFILKLLYLVIAFTERKQGLHDVIGNTTVIHEAS